MHLVGEFDVNTVHKFWMVYRMFMPRMFTVMFGF